MKQVRVFLWIAAALAALSLTPFGDAWQVMVLPPAPVAVPGSDTVVFVAPHEAVFQWIIEAWQSVLKSMANTGLLSERQAARIIAHGFLMQSVLQVLAAISAAIALVFSMRGANTASQPLAPAREQIASSLQQVQLGVTNLLLNPDAQPVAEPLADIAMRLRSAQDIVAALDSTQR